MARKNQPGCPCCSSGCCTGSDTPVITISGYTATSTSADIANCCVEKTFTPDTEDSTDCCTEVATHTLTIECLNEYYTLLRPKPKVSATTLACPLPDDYCCFSSPTKIGEVLTTYNLVQKSYFTSRINLETVKVIWGKREVTCSGVTECKYFVKVIFEVSYYGYINTQARRHGSIVGSSTDACITYDGSVDDSWDVKDCPDADICDVNWSISDPCFASVGGVSECLEVTGTTCVERIKFFSTRPTGNITFTSSDVLGDCDDVSCGDACGNYASSVCVSPPASIYPPKWCDNPPTVSQVTNNYTSTTACSGDQTVLIIDPFDCCTPTNQICRTDNNCTVSFSQVCETLTIPGYTQDPEECRFPTKDIDWLGYSTQCGCYSGSLPPSFFDLPDCTTAPCNTSCCWEPVVCVPCPYCYAKYGVSNWWSSNTITVTTNCGAYTKPSDCCWPVPNITVNITY